MIRIKKNYLAIKHLVLCFIMTGFCTFLIFCASDLVKVKNKKTKRAIKKLISQYRSDDWEKRLMVIQTISKYAYLEEIDITEDIFIKASYDIHLAVRIEAIQALIKFPTKKSNDRIVRIISSTGNENEKWYALKTLAFFRNPASYAIFVNGLNSKDWIIREISIKGLLMIDNISLIYKLIPYIINSLNDPIKSVRIAALEYLKIKDNRIYNTILLIFEKEYTKKNSLFKASLKALKGYKLDKKTRQKVIDLLVDRDSEIRIYAFRILKEDRTPRKIN